MKPLQSTLLIKATFLEQWYVYRATVSIDQEAALYCSELLEHWATVKTVTKDLDFIRLSEEKFSQCEDIS